MAQTASMQIQGFEKLIKKLNVDALVKPEWTVLFKDASSEGSSFLGQKLGSNFPKTAASVRATSNDAEGRITAARYPYVFFERGSQYPVARQFAPGGGGARRHRRRAGISNSSLRLKPRRYLSQTRAYLRRDLPKLINAMRDRVEKRWAE